MKKTKSPVKKPVTDQDFVSHSLEDILTETYGQKGTEKRTKADARLSSIAGNLGILNTLKIIRESRHKTQKQVADLMDVDHTVISKFESHVEKAQLSTLLRYAKALNAKHVNITFEFDKKHTQVLELTP
jgi:DNA-binding XRE family transcriptional regulator